MMTRDRSTRFAERLEGLVRRSRRMVLGHGSARTTAVGGGALLAAAWAVGAGPRSEGFLAWGLTLSLVLVIVLAVRNWLVAPLSALRSGRAVARRLEERGGFGNILVGAEEALRLPDRWPGDDPVRRELRRRLFERAEGILDVVGPADVEPPRHRRGWLAAATTVLALAVAYLTLAPSEFGTGLTRLATPWPDNVTVVTGGLYGIKGDGFVVAGGDVNLAALDFAAPDVAGGTGKAVCEIRSGRGLWQPLPTMGVPVHGDQPGLPAPYRRWTAGVEDVHEDFSWRFRRGSLVSAEHTIRVRQYPLVTALAARVVPPAYTKVPVQDLARLPVRFEVPAGSELRLKARTNHPVSSARAVTTAGDTITATVDSNGMAIRFEVPATLIFHLEVEDAFGLTNRNPLRYEVIATPDERPLVELLRPDDDGVLPLAGDLMLEVSAVDDFGLDAVRLLVRTLSPRAGRDEAPWHGGSFWPGEDGGWRSWPVPPGELALRAHRVDEGRSSLRTRFRVEVRAGELDLVPGDILEIVAEAVDNKRPLPAGTSRSRVLRLTLPSAADVLDLQAEAAEEHKSDLEEMRRRGGELESDLDRLNRELMKNPLPDWARQQEMEKAIQRQKALQEELARVAAELQQELENLARGQLTSEEQLEKADQVSELLSQEGSERLEDLLARLEEGSTQVSPEEVARVMDEVARNQKDMARRLDAALSMLQRMAQEQELEGLTALVEQMMRKQQELAELSREMAEAESQEGESESGETPDGEPREGESQDGETREGENQGDENTSSDPAAEDKPTPEELARRQEALAEELEQLQEKLAEALEQMKEQNEAADTPEHQKELAESLEEALEKMKDQQSSEKMEQASESLQEMDPEKAAEMQEQALRDLGALYHVMLQTQQAMQAAMQMEQVSSLRGLAADLLAVSTRQEEIVAKIPPRLRDLRTLELTRSQHRVQKAAAQVRENLAELMDESPTRILRLLEKLDALIEEMGTSLRAMEENRAAVARRHARESLASSNRIVIGLLTEAQMSGGQGAGGSSKPSAGEQLQEMIRKQAELNGVTEELRRMLADRGMSQESRSQMERLGQEQADLAERMGQLAEEQSGSAGQGGEGGQAGQDGKPDGPEVVPERVRPEAERLLGDLSQLGRDMETVGEDIEGGLISEDTLRRQERILSRMLDARNSVRERDYSNRRESRTAGRLYGDQAGREGSGDDEDRPGRRRFQPLEKAPLEYRDLVRRYFSALDSLRLQDLEGSAPVPDTRTETP